MPQHGQEPQLLGLTLRAVWVQVGYDSREGNARFVPHSSFKDPSAPANPAPRCAQVSGLLASYCLLLGCAGLPGPASSLASSEAGLCACQGERGGPRIRVLGARQAAVRSSAHGMSVHSVDCSCLIEEPSQNSDLLVVVSESCTVPAT